MQHRAPKDVPTGERVKELATAMANAMMHKSRGQHETEEGAAFSLEPAAVEELIEEWPNAPKLAARKMMEQYGPPNEATATKLFWYRNGPWKRTIVTRDVLVHNFPAPHSDFLTQVIDYHVPLEKVSDIARYDGSCLVDRTAGEVAARCDSEAANTITLNLMHELATGEVTVEEAREIYSENVAAYAMGRPAPYVEQFRFRIPGAGTEDLDETTIGDDVIKQVTAAAKDMLSELGEAPDRKG
jgi:hypothetical protein